MAIAVPVAVGERAPRAYHSVMDGVAAFREPQAMRTTLDKVC